MQRSRLFTVAAVYDSGSGQRLSMATSVVGVGCAERRALWKLKDTHSPKLVVVARVRRTRNGFTFGGSRPCQQCMTCMTMYGVQRVVFSVDKKSFSSLRLDPIRSSGSDYHTTSPVILSTAHDFL